MSKTIQNLGNTYRIDRVEVDEEYEFFGYYKDHSISVSLDPDNPDQWVIIVKDATGEYAVDALEQFETINLAIIFAISGALLEPRP